MAAAGVVERQMQKIREEAAAADMKGTMMRKGRHQSTRSETKFI